MAKKMTKQAQNPRVFLGLQEIAGYYSQLVEGLRQLDCQADFYALSDHPFNYANPHQVDNLLTRICCGLKRREVASKKRVKIIFWLLLQDFVKLVLFARVLFQYDAFVFCYRSTFFHYLELPVLKFFRKRIIYVLHGSDSRPPYLDGTAFFQDPAYLKHKTRKVKRFVSKIEKYADLVVVNPASAQFLSKPFVNSMIIGVPFKCNELVEVEQSDLKTLRIVHSPSNPEAKGSAKILEVVNKVQKTHPEIEFIELRNRSHSEVLSALQSCDFVIDQLYSDSPLAGVATEAAFFW